MIFISLLIHSSSTTNVIETIDTSFHTKIANINNNNLKLVHTNTISNTNTITNTITKLEYNSQKASKVNKLEKAIDNIKSSSSQGYFRKLFGFKSTLNKCLEKDCQYCCLNLNFCGSKAQCENSKFTLLIFKCLFLFICSILVFFISYKIYLTSPESEHSPSDMTDDRTLLNLVQSFVHSRDSRRKFRFSSAVR